MPRSTVIPKPDPSVVHLITSARSYRCACCSGPTLPVLEWHPPEDTRPGYYLCHHCAQGCQTKVSKRSGLRFEHKPYLGIRWEQADRQWATDLGFKRLTKTNI